MSGALGIVAFVVTILVMVALHEFGHFVAAKSFGIKVEEFFIGFGPRLFSRRRGETEYGVKALLLGGYVKIAGMNPWQTLPASDLPRTYGAKPAWQRALLLAAGSTTHLVLACVVLALVFGLSGVPEGPTTVLESVFAGPSGGKGPAAEAGIREGDRIVALAGRPISSWEEVRRRVRARPGQTIEVEVVRASRRLSFTVTLEEAKDPSGGAGTIGLLGVIPEISYRRLAPHEAAWEGARTTGLMVGASVRGVGQVFSPGGLRRLVASLTEQGERSTEEPLGLFGGARIAGQAAAAGEIEDLILFLAGFIVFVGVINLAPLPPLDGGHLLVLLVEKITGREVDMRRVAPVAAFVVSLFVALAVALLYLDIFRPVQNPFQ